ncbi:unnamed protein product, partial [Prorocentrum cordatum]
RSGSCLSSAPLRPPPEAMARSRGIAAPAALAAAVALWACSVAVRRHGCGGAERTPPVEPSMGLPAFVPPALRAAPVHLAAAATAALAPAAAQADVMDVPDMSSSISLAGLYEPIMLGIVFGTTFTTLLGLLVAAWLQFKKGPTLGL